MVSCVYSTVLCSNALYVSIYSLSIYFSDVKFHSAYEFDTQYLKNKNISKSFRLEGQPIYLYTLFYSYLLKNEEETAP